MKKRLFFILLLPSLAFAEVLQEQIINALNQQEDILLTDGFWFWKSTFRIPAQGFKEVWQKMLDFQQQIKSLPPESLILPKVHYVKPLLPERVLMDNSGYPEYRKPPLSKEYTEIYQPLTQKLHSRYGCTNNDTLFFYPLNEKESRLTYACWVDSNVGSFKGWGPHPEHPILDLVINNRSLSILGNWQDSSLYHKIQQQAKQRYSQCNEMPKFFLDQILLAQDKRFLIGKCGTSDNEWSSTTFSFVWLMDNKAETLLQEWRDAEQQSVSASIDGKLFIDKYKWAGDNSDVKMAQKYSYVWNGTDFQLSAIKQPYCVSHSNSKDCPVGVYVGEIYQTEVIESKFYEYIQVK